VVTPRTVLAFSENEKSVKVGESFSVDVVSDPQGNSIVIVEPHVSYDPSVFQLLEVKQTESYPQVLSSEQIDSGKATITVGAVSISQPVVKKASAATFVFKALKPVSSSTISFDDKSFVGSLADKSGPQNMITTRKNLTVTVSQ
jgi:hypothetical protein